MYNLKEIMNEVYLRDFAAFDTPPRHHFSRKSRKRLNDILYPNTFQPVQIKLPLRKRLLVMLMVILLMIIGTTAGAAIANGFLRKEHSDNTELFGPADINSPKAIEKMYYFPYVPEEYELNEMIADDVGVSTSYVNRKTGRYLTLRQTVKELYVSHVDNEHTPPEEVDINGHYGLYLGKGTGWGQIIWDNGDYILELFGDFDKEELLNLAKSAEF